MDDLFRDRFRVSSARCQAWDYGSAGFYFVTVCTRDRQQWLAEVDGERLILLPAGEIVVAEWEATPVLRPGVGIDSLVVMPDHLHAIVEISPHASTPRGRPWRRNVLGSVVNAVKAACARRIRLETVPEFAWQPRFHDVIIRSDVHLDRARQYIADNPARWIAGVQTLSRTAS